MARFAVNSVTHGDYLKPIQISKFVSELHSGFRLLNLKNDSLRKKFDAIKYDVRKIEEVVYDMSLRGLSAGETAQTSITETSTSDSSKPETPTHTASSTDDSKSDSSKSAATMVASDQ